MQDRERKDWLGALAGILAFAFGIGLLALTFWFAKEIFLQSPDQNLGIKKGQALDLAELLRLGVTLVTRIAMLLVMGYLASMIANRGLKMYSERRTKIDRESHRDAISDK